MTVIRFAGANIKGWPAMAAGKVRHDLRVVQARADVVVAQEFRWPAYWRILGRHRSRGWACYPGYAAGLLAPVRSGQPVLWRRKLLRKTAGRVRLLHSGEAGISEDRYLRAARLQLRGTKSAAWFGGTHFVVGADEAGDGRARKNILYQLDLPRFDEFIGDLLATGDPVVWEMDANIHKGSAAYDDLLRIIAKHGGQIVGTHGVEYLIVFPGTDARFVASNKWVVNTDLVFTDHEVRGVTGRIAPPPKEK